MLSETTRIIINSVLNGEINKINFREHVIPSDVDDYLNSIEEFEHFEIETNGWQVDYWITWERKKDKKVFMLSGMLFYSEQNFGIKEI